MSDDWPPPRHLVIYLIIRLALLASLIILISTGLLTKILLPFVPFMVLALVATWAYRRTTWWTRGWRR